MRKYNIQTESIFRRAACFICQDQTIPLMCYSVTVRNWYWLQLQMTGTLKIITWFDVILKGERETW